MKKNKVLDGLMGVAIGDALGVPVEFYSREFLKRKPVEDMIGYGTHKQPPGTWSDDSSLTFCLAEGLCDEYDLRNIGNRFVNWYRYDYWTPHGYVFDIGGTTERAIINLEEKVLKPERCGGKEERDNGNGSLMRILPIVFYVFKMSEEKKYKVIQDISSLTHAHKRSIISCCIYVEIAINIIKGMEKIEAYNEMKKTIKCYFEKEEEFQYFHRIIEQDIYKVKEEFIRSSGYVIDTLEAGLWSFFCGSNFEECVLKAVNLGDDTDTIGAVTGGLAGLYYGFQNIPQKWIDVIAKRDEIIELGNRLYEKLKNDF